MPFDLRAQKRTVFFCLLWVAAILCPPPGHAFGAPGARSAGRDTNGDGKVDQKATFNEAGQMVRLFADRDFDGRMDTFQYYEKAKLARVERDLDGDGRPDVKDYYRCGRRVRQERFDAEGRIRKVVYLDDAGSPVKQKADTDGDGRLDTLSRYRDGRAVLIRHDRNGDGKFDKIVYYDASGNPEKIEFDPGGDGTWGEVRYFEGQSLVRVEKDRNGDGSADWRMVYKNGRKHRLWLDDDFDGRTDSRVHYDSAGRPARRETRADGADDWNLTWHYDHDRGIVRGEKDADADGKTDIWYIYEQQRLVEVREDTDGDRRPDLWEFYDEKENLQRISRDLNHDGVPDMHRTVSAGLLPDGSRELQTPNKPEDVGNDN